MTVRVKPTETLVSSLETKHGGQIWSTRDGAWCWVHYSPPNEDWSSSVGSYESAYTNTQELTALTHLWRDMKEIEERITQRMEGCE